VRFWVTVPVMDRLVDENWMVNVGGGGGGATAVTFTVASALKKPVALAKMFVEPTATGVMENDTPVAVAGTVTVAGTVAMVVSRTARLTTCPLVPAGDESVTVIIPGVPAMLKGLGVSVSVWLATVTVAGALLAMPSFTINWAT
jgi:hypothetical protein